MENTEKNTRQFVHYAGALFLAVASLAVIWQMLGPSWFKNIKAEVTNQPYARTITVNGEGKVTTKPDIAMVSFSVVSEAKTVKEATDAGNKKMNDVIQALKKMNIEEKDLVTTQYSLQPKYDDVLEPFSYSIKPFAAPAMTPAVDQPVSSEIMAKPVPSNPVPVPPSDTLSDLLDEMGIDADEAMQLYTAYVVERDTAKALKLLDEFGIDPADAAKLYAVFSAGMSPEGLMRAPLVPKIVGYSLHQTIQVKVRKLEEADQVIDTAVKAGSNQVGQLYFDIDDPKQVEKEAREKAFKAALEKAQEMTGAAGVKLGRVVTFTEGYGYQPYSYRTMEMSVLKADVPAAAPAIEPGSKEVILNVSVTYEIE